MSKDLAFPKLLTRDGLLSSNHGLPGTTHQKLWNRKQNQNDEVL